MYVPCGTLDAYKSAEGWKEFRNIREWDATTGVEMPTISDDDVTVEADGRQITVKTDGRNVRVRVYSAGGSMVYDGGEGTFSVPAQGLYIVRAGNHTEKLLVK